jgi:hypothetical protein
MARSGTYVTKQNKVEDCRQWPIHHQGPTGISKVTFQIKKIIMSVLKILTYIIYVFFVSVRNLR